MQQSDSAQVKYAKELIQGGDRVTARDILREVISRQPDDVYAWAYLAQVALTREEAMSALGHVLRLNPGDGWATKRLRQLRAPVAQPTVQASPRALKRRSWLEIVVFYGGILLGVVLLCAAIYLAARLLTVYGPTF